MGQDVMSLRVCDPFLIFNQLVPSSHHKSFKILAEFGSVLRHTHKQNLNRCSSLQYETDIYHMICKCPITKDMVL